MKQRRWLRFSLRTFLVLLTVFCVWIGWQANRAHRQRVAVEEVRQAKGSVTYAAARYDRFVPSWLRRLAGDDFFRTAISAEFTPHSGKWHSAVQKLPDLTRLEFRSCTLQEQDFVAMSSCGRLEVLSLSSCACKIDDMAPLKDAPRLKTIGLINMPTAENPARFRPYSRDLLLDVHSSESRNALEQLQKMLPGVTLGQAIMVR